MPKKSKGSILGRLSAKVKANRKLRKDEEYAETEKASNQARMAARRQSEKVKDEERILKEIRRRTNHANSTEL